MPEKWYKNPLPGYSVMDNEEVVILPRKQGSDSVPATREYSGLVLEEVERLKDEGWTGFIAPEAHQADKGAGDAWHWDVDNPGPFLEAIYFGENASLEEVREQYTMHNGQAWQFPILFCFPFLPNDAIMSYLSQGQCPVALMNEMDVEYEEDEAPDDEIDWQTIAIRRLIHIGDMQDGITDVVRDAVYLRSNFRSMRKRRKYIRQFIIEPLREAINLPPR